MPASVHARTIRGFAWASIALVSWVSPARADIVYDYANHFLFDSVTGLYWQLVQVPSATFMPSHGTITDLATLAQLEVDAGAPNSSYPGSTAPYSPTLANFLSFFASGRPATPGAPTTFDALYQYPPDLPLGGYQYIGYQYAPVTDSTAWQFYSISTVGTYGPGHPRCQVGVCAPTQPALVYSDIRPVPVSGSGSLFLCGLALLAMVGIRHSNTSLPLIGIASGSRG